MANPIETELRELFAKAAAEDERFALAAAYAKGTEEPKVMATGPLHIGSPRQVGTDAAWHVGSITKPFTATLILKLVERGRLALDASVGSYLTDVATDMHADWRNRTLRQLLSHTAGLPANASILQLLKSETGDPAQERINVLRSLWARRLTTAPGSFAYSNIGYVLAGVVAEQVTGEPWEALVTSEIAEPLGLTSLGFGPPSGTDAPWGHRSFFGLKRPADPNGKRTPDNPAWMGPAGRLHMTLQDLIGFAQAHLNAPEDGRSAGLLSRASCRIMQTAISDEYGLGWVLQSQADTNTPLVWHNGSNTMWYAILVLAPEHNAALAIALNAYGAARVDRLAHEMMAVLIRPAAAAG